MKDLVPSAKIGVSELKGQVGTQPRVWIKNEAARVGLAETLSTYVMMAFGLGSVAQVVTGQGAFGQYISINIAFGLAVAMGTYVGGKVSGMSADPLKCVDLTCSSPAADRVLISFPGAHMNGAVSFTMCVFGRLTWKMLPLYICAQLLGSFLASGTIYAIYYEAIHNYCGGNLTVTGPKATAGIFATYPAPYLSLVAGFVDQVFGTAMLLLCVMALSDQKNKPPPAGSEPVIVGLLVMLIGMSLGSNSGYAINPTRDIAPRFFTAIAGWGFEVFRAGNCWWWVTLVAPLIGGVLGAGVYKAFVELHHPHPPEQNRVLGEDEHIPLVKRV
uniref:Aquaporin 7 n=1 Tax=Oryzias sinensis TaxID=183150 RepID=A0A8C7X3G9_9TELE